jgi:hypothetical protein
MEHASVVLVETADLLIACLCRKLVAASLHKWNCPRHSASHCSRNFTARTTDVSSTAEPTVRLVESHRRRRGATCRQPTSTTVGAIQPIRTLATSLAQVAAAVSSIQRQQCDGRNGDSASDSYSGCFECGALDHVARDCVLRRQRASSRSPLRGICSNAPGVVEFSQRVSMLRARQDEDDGRRRRRRRRR